MSDDQKRDKAIEALKHAAFYGKPAGAAVEGKVIAGSAYPSFGNDAVVRESGTRPPIKVTVTDNSQWLGKMLKKQIEENAKGREEGSGEK